jgi:hypothetical protein
MPNIGHNHRRHASYTRLVSGQTRTNSDWGKNDLSNGDCVASSECPEPLIAGAPVRLCGKHIREVYEFAQDLVTDRWDGAVREYVAGLHDTFKPPPAVKKRPRQGYVYFIRLGDRIKIGYTENVDRRLSELPHEEVLGVIPGTRDDEQGWHRLLADYRTVGEWFLADPEVLEAVARVVATAAS